MIQSQNIIIDINEAHHTTLNLMNFKKILMTLSEKKNVYLATATPDAWLDSAHTLIHRKEFEFVVEDLSAKAQKSKQTA